MTPPLDELPPEERARALDELERVHASVLEGEPWQLGVAGNANVVCLYDSNILGIATSQHHDDAIVAFQNAIPALLRLARRVAALTEERDAARAEVERVRRVAKDAVRRRIKDGFARHDRPAAARFWLTRILDREVSDVEAVEWLREQED